MDPDDWRKVEQGYDLILERMENDSFYFPEVMTLLDKIQELAPNHAGLAYLRIRMCLQRCEWTNFQGYMERFVRKYFIFCTFLSRNYVGQIKILF